MPAFIPGLQLSRQFFATAIRPLLREAFPTIPYAAGLLGRGSEVLGFDTELSTDHNWGPRVDIYLRNDAPSDLAVSMRARLDADMPDEFMGWRVRFASQLPRATSACGYGVHVSTAAHFFQSYLGLDIAQPIEPADWLTLPAQKLRTVALGEVFHDEIGLASIRASLAWYPHDVWLYLLASAWTRTGQEEHLMGRAGSVGDEVGSAIIGARLVRDAMRLCFFMERQFPPYAKWFGSAFQRLRCAPSISSGLAAVVHASAWQEREASLTRVYEAIARLHNALGVTPPLATSVVPFFSRPFASIALNGFAEATTDVITLLIWPSTLWR